MSEDGRRPGGLTALAVINFVFGGLTALAALAITAVVGVADNQNAGEITRQTGGMIWLLAGLIWLTAALLIVSGIGYLGCKKVMGRVFGSIYGILGVAGVAVGLASGNQPFGIQTMINVVYPLLTLVLLNTTFKDDLVR